VVTKKVTTEKRPNVISFLTAGMVGVGVLPTMGQIRAEIKKLKSA
jgi:hypothetical protein